MKDTLPNRISCFLCGNGLDVRTSKRDKPYLVCEPCGMQIFVRRSCGIERLKARQLAARDGIQIGEADADMEILSLSNRLLELKAALRKIEADEPFLGGFFTEENPAKKVIQTQIRSVETRIKAFD